MRACALALLSLAACGRLDFGTTADAGADASVDANPTTNAAPAPWTNGTRLKAFRTATGTIEQFAGWHDSLYNVDCVPRVAEDGVTRCLPDAYTIQPTVFMDAGCAQPLAAGDPSVSACGFPAQFGISLGDMPAIRALSVAHPGGIYSGSPASCTFLPTDPPNIDYYEVSGPIMPDTFVGAHEELTRNHDLSYREDVFDDGARLLSAGAYDHRIDDTCSIRQISRDRALCVPDHKASNASLYYDEPGCTHSVAHPTTPGAEIFLLGADQVCGDRVRAFARGDEVTGTIYARTSSGCVAQTPGPTFQIGPARTDLPVFTRAVDPGSEAVQTARWRTDDGFDLPNALHLWDPARNDWCDPVALVATDTFVCAPWWTALQLDVYTDSSCVDEQTFITADCVDAGAAIYFPDAGGNHSTCDGRRFSVRPIDAPYSSPEAYMLSEQGCLAVDPGQLKALGLTEIMAADVPALELRR